MTGAVCPACGVAVVPGYVRCPKCHRPLPRFARSSASPVGGTALSSGSSSPILAIVAAVAIAGGIIGYFALRKKSHATAATPTTTDTGSATTETPQLANPTTTVTPNAPTKPRGPAPEPIAAELERSLKHARLWSTVNVVGDHVEVRSGSCADPQMKPALDAVAGSLKTAGIVRIRCVEQSGTVAFDRDL